jgi:hypothetical protein
MSMPTTTRWIPSTATERDLVMAELNAIVSSYHFRNSKRYPALLTYLVSKTLEGDSSSLKERTLGVEVFDRTPDYDTNADPVVRLSAGQVRRRIAQYYFESAESGVSSALHIDLPLGSYIPEFRLLSEALATADSTVPDRARKLPGILASARFRSKTFRWSAAAVLVMALAGGLYAYHRATAGDVTQKLWGEFLQPQGPVMIVMGTSHPELGPTQETTQTTLIEHERELYHHVSLSSAVALSRVAGVLRMHGKAYTVKEDSNTSLVDLRSRPIILIGAMNNQWTMRLIKPLRFRFMDGPMAQIIDSKDPGNLSWRLDFTQPYTAIPNDYAIVARYHDASTGGPVLIVAGLGIYGTEAASEFVASPEYLDQIFKNIPDGWENKNIELILKTNTVDGESGPPTLISSFVW